MEKKSIKKGGGPTPYGKYHEKFPYLLAPMVLLGDLWPMITNLIPSHPIQWTKMHGEKGGGQGGVVITNFRSIVLDDHCSKKIYKPKMIVVVRCYINLTWSCFKSSPLPLTLGYWIQCSDRHQAFDKLVQNEKLADMQLGIAIYLNTALAILGSALQVKDVDCCHLMKIVVRRWKCWIICYHHYQHKHQQHLLVHICTIFLCCLDGEM